MIEIIWNTYYNNIKKGRVYMIKKYLNKDLPNNQLRNRVEIICILGYIIYLLSFLCLYNLFH